MNEEFTSLAHCGVPAAEECGAQEHAAAEQDLSSGADISIESVASSELEEQPANAEIAPKDLPTEDETAPLRGEAQTTASLHEGTQAKAARKRWIAGIVSICAVLLASTAALLWVFGIFDRIPELVLIDDGTIAVGVTVDGVAVGGDDRAAALSKFETTTEQEGPYLPIVISNRTEKLYLKDLGLRTTPEHQLETALLVGRTGGIEQRMESRESARQSGLAVHSDFEYDPATVEENLRKFSASVPRDPVEEQVIFKPETEERFEFIEQKDGFVPDEEAFVAAAMERIEKGDFSELVMPGEARPCTGESKGLIENTTLIAKFTTSFAGSIPGRVQNIKESAKRCNGTILQPGEVFSCNEAMGPRTDPNVWGVAGAIVGGVMTTGRGGGICQTSTTLFNAVFCSDLEIVDWHVHAIPASYVPKGTDATMSWGGPDFQFRNNTDYPIYIVMYTEGTTVTAEIWGRPLPDGMTVEILPVITGYIAQPADIEVTDPSQVSSGYSGCSFVTYRVYKDKDGNEIERVLMKKDYYPARAARVLKKEEPAPTPGGDSEAQPNAGTTTTP